MKIAIILLIALCTQLSAQVVTLAAGYRVGSGIQTSYTIPAGESVEVDYIITTYGTNNYLQLTSPQGDSIKIGADVRLARIPVSGGWTVSVSASAIAGHMTFAQVRTIESPTNSSFLPTNTVVIPEDSTGPVEIILESSTDLISWNAALPGTYGSSDPNRFFRVRAVANP